MAAPQPIEILAERGRGADRGCDGVADSFGHSRGQYPQTLRAGSAARLPPPHAPVP
jgi:hypothetical protein